MTPPTAATWMLKHLLLGKGNEALEGDLLEEFQRGRSANWYWRQVLLAVLGFSNLSQAAWLTFWTVIFAVIWVCGLHTAASLTAHLSIQTAFGNWLNRVPYGKAIWIAEGIVFSLGVPLSVYLALVRNLSLRPLTVGIAAGVLTIVALPFLQFQVNTPFNYAVAYALEKGWNVTLWLRWYQALQGDQAPVGIIPLLAAMWAASLCKTMTSNLDAQEAAPHESK